MHRKALDQLLPEEFRRFDVADRSYIRSPEDSRPEPPSGPRPKRVIVTEKPLVRRPDPVMGYAKLGGSQVWRVQAPKAPVQMPGTLPVLPVVG